MYSPTNRAIGMVQAMVNVPHELPGTTCTQPAGSSTVCPVPIVSASVLSGMRI